MQAVFLAAALAAAGFPLGVTSANAGPNCTCRYSGGEINEGETACIKSPNGMTMARCEKVLNNTSWKMLDQPCPYSRAIESQPTDFAMLSTADAPIADLTARLPQ